MIRPYFLHSYYHGLTRGIYCRNSETMKLSVPMQFDENAIRHTSKNWRTQPARAWKKLSTQFKNTKCFLPFTPSLTAKRSARKKIKAEAPYDYDQQVKALSYVDGKASKTGYFAALRSGYTGTPTVHYKSIRNSLNCSQQVTQKEKEREKARKRTKAKRKHT